MAFHAIWKPENFDNSLSKNSKRKLNFQSDFAPKLALANNADLPKNLNEWPRKKEKTNQLIFNVLS
ncbi:hypothetical protein BOO33_18150 [Vibrio navarrensis]|nr:hypothetical protein [Vibrio navarrensis]MBE4601972.1 hypothetical protein [Vibrio navarrensis]